MHLPSLTACVLALSSGATALRHGEQDNGVVQALWDAPHAAAHPHQGRDGFVIADGKRISRRTHAKLHARQPPPPPPPAPGPPPPPPPGGGPGSSWKDKPTAPSHVKIKADDLWRGETFRTPEDVRKAGGFDSHAKRIFEGTHPDYRETGMTEEAFKMGSSVYHHSKKTCSCSSYVSMSASKDEAINFANKPTAKRTYVYRIKPETSKVVDVAGSLGGDRHLTWTKEKEVAGVYEVPWKQVVGWHEGTPTEVQGQGTKIVFSDFIKKNDVYPDDPLPDEAPLSGDFEIRSELAGFPEGHLGRTEQPWKQYNDVSVEQWLNEYMLDRIFNKDKAKFSEARGAAKWASLPCSSAKRKRAGAPAGCDRVNNQAVEGEEVARPGNGEDGSGLEGEEGSGAKELSEMNEKWAAAAEEISKREFTDLVTSRGLAKVIKNKFSKTVAEFRGGWLGYQPLTKASPKFQTIYAVAGKLAKPLEKIGAPLWALGVVDAFARQTSALEKTAAITAIVPFLGCTVDLAAKESKGTIDPLDTTLCYLADGLMFTPLWPAALVVQAIRAIINAFNPPDVPSPEKLHEKRDKEWTKLLDNTIYTYIYSDEFATKEKTFREKMNGSFVAEASLVLSDTAESIGVTNVTGQRAMEVEKDAGRKAVILNGTQTAITGLRARADAEIRRRQRKSLLELPEKLSTSHGVSLQALAKAFQDEYIANLQSDAFKKRYTKILNINAAEVEAKLAKAVEYIKPKALSMPTLFDIAYVVGQSKALEDVDPAALSAREFIADSAANVSDSRVNTYALHHTQQVARLLRGEEVKLDARWPTDDPAAAATTGRLQLLIAMRFGRVYEERKMAWIREERKGVLGLFPDAREGEIHWASHPDIPSRKGPGAAAGVAGANGSPSYLGVVLGLSEEIVRNTPTEAQPFGFQDIVQKADMMLALLKADRYAAGKRAAGKAEGQKPKMTFL